MANAFATSGQPFTARELEVIKLVARDLTAAEIAERLGVTEKTVQVHVSNAIAKAGCRTRVGVVVKYLTGI